MADAGTPRFDFVRRAPGEKVAPFDNSFCADNAAELDRSGVAIGALIRQAARIMAEGSAFDLPWESTPLWLPNPPVRPINSIQSQSRS